MSTSVLVSKQTLAGINRSLNQCRYKLSSSSVTTVSNAAGRAINRGYCQLWTPGFRNQSLSPELRQPGLAREQNNAFVCLDRWMAPTERYSTSIDNVENDSMRGRVRDDEWVTMSE